MRNILDHGGRVVRLTDERLEHILNHPEMKEMEYAITQTLSRPSQVVQSRRDEQVSLYYRGYEKTLVGTKYLCVVVRMTRVDAFIITAYLTDHVKKGTVLWNATT